MADTTYPQMPAELAEIIATHRALFGGFTMMADEAPIEPEAAGQPNEAETPGDHATDAEKLGEGGKKAIQAEREARKQAEKALADLQKQIADANKTAEEKAAEALTEAQRAAAENAAKALRYEVAAAKGLDLKLASRLTGATKEDLEADAENLKALLAASAIPPGPRPDPSQGHGSDPKPTTLTQAINAHYA